MSTSKMSNVEDVSAADHSILDNTVSEAAITAPNANVTRQIERNAGKEQQAAQQAASIAKSMGSDYTGEATSAVGEFKDSAVRKTNAAVAEGKYDVAAAKAAGAAYVEKAKELATSALETAQSYLPESVGGSPPSTTTESKAGSQTPGAGVLASVEATAENVYNKVAGAARPHIERAKSAAQSYTAAVQGQKEHTTSAGGTESPLKPAGQNKVTTASSAPLESGPHTVDAPYPAMSSSVKAGDIAASGGQPVTHN
ncbi:hypothetical protein BJ912DRAFT_942716 [Pholiota molesta]|nr:hypothetical protein BJ912DRAFT_942716 [Pholiota molesta]